MRSRMCCGGLVRARNQESRARSTRSPCATTYPIAASMSTTIVTLQLNTAFGCAVPTTRPPHRKVRRPQREGSVRRQGGIDRFDPGEHAALDVDGVLEAGRLQCRERLRRPHARLAVQHDLLVLRELRQRLTGEDVALRDEGGARDAHDL